MSSRFWNSCINSLQLVKIWIFAPISGTKNHFSRLPNAVVWRQYFDSVAKNCMKDALKYVLYMTDDNLSVLPLFCEISHQHAKFSVLMRNFWTGGYRMLLGKNSEHIGDQIYITHLSHSFGSVFKMLEMLKCHQKPCWICVTLLLCIWNPKSNTVTQKFNRSKFSMQLLDITQKLGLYGAKFCGNVTSQCFDLRILQKCVFWCVCWGYLENTNFNKVLFQLVWI